MYSFFKFAVLFILTVSISLNSCKGKAEKRSIVGKWKYKETSFKSSKKYEDLSTKQRQSIKERNNREGEYFIYTFHDDKTYSACFLHLGEEFVTYGTYEISNEDLLFYVDGEKQPERTKILLLEKNMLKLRDAGNGGIAVFSRIQ